MKEPKYPFWLIIKLTITLVILVGASIFFFAKIDSVRIFLLLILAMIISIGLGIYDYIHSREEKTGMMPVSIILTVIDMTILITIILLKIFLR